MLVRHADVREAVVVGIADADYGEEVVAAVVLEPSAPMDADRLRTHGAGELAGYKVPTGLSALPPAAQPAHRQGAAHRGGGAAARSGAVPGGSVMARLRVAAAAAQSGRAGLRPLRRARRGPRRPSRRGRGRAAGAPRSHHDLVSPPTPRPRADRRRRHRLGLPHRLPAGPYVGSSVTWPWPAARPSSAAATTDGPRTAAIGNTAHRGSRRPGPAAGEAAPHTPGGAMGTTPGSEVSSPRWARRARRSRSAPRSVP